MSFQNIKNLKAVDIILQVDNSKTKFEVNEVRKLNPSSKKNKIVVRCLQTYINTRLAVTAIGKAVASEAAVRDCYLVIVDGDEQVLDTIALQNLLPLDYNGERFFVNYDNVDWSRSYIQFGRTTNLPVLASATNIVITVFFTEEPIEEPIN